MEWINCKWHLLCSFDESVLTEILKVCFTLVNTVTSPPIHMHNSSFSNWKTKIFCSRVTSRTPLHNIHSEYYCCLKWKWQCTNIISGVWGSRPCFVTNKWCDLGPNLTVSQKWVELYLVTFKVPEIQIYDSDLPKVFFHQHIFLKNKV